MRWLLVLLFATTVAAAPKDRAATAEKVYKTEVALLKSGRATAEQVYQWSLRWLDAAMASGTAPKAALTDHLARMKDLEAETARMRDAGVIGTADADAATYFRQEAEEWQLRGKRS